MLHGSCLCAGVRWEYEGPLQFLAACHCTRCRKHHGAAFGAFAGAAAAGYRLVQGRELIARYEEPPGGPRGFCSRCGSKVPLEPEPGGMAMMPAGAFDDDPGVPLSAHIFVASKAPWYEIGGEAARFDAYPPDVPAPALETPQRPVRAGMLGGSCLCNGVAYELESRLDVLNHCHCSRCRKARGSAHASNLFGPADALRWVRGQDRLESYKVPEAKLFTHVFCRTCGGSMPRLRENVAVVPAGTLDVDPGPVSQRHVFVGSRAPWFPIADALPQFDASPY